MPLHPVNFVQLFINTTKLCLRLWQHHLSSKVDTFVHCNYIRQRQQCAQHWRFLIKPAKATARLVITV